MPFPVHGNRRAVVRSTRRMQAHAMTLGVHAIGIRTIVNVKARSYGHGGRPAVAFAPRACTHSEPRLGAEATRARAIRARVFARRAREIRPVLGLGDHTGLVHPPPAARGPTAAHAASGGDDDIAHHGHRNGRRPTHHCAHSPPLRHGSCSPTPNAGAVSMGPTAAVRQRVRQPLRVHAGQSRRLL